MRPCPACGEIHERCAAHRKTDGRPCGRWPKKGMTVCRQCGGGAPQVQAAAERRLHEAEVEVVSRRYLDNPNIGPMTDPADRLLRLAARVEAAADAVGARVNQLTEISVETFAGGEQIKAEVAVWDKLLGRLHGLLVDIQRLGLQERQVRLAEAQAERLAAEVTRMMSELRTRLDLDEAGQAALVEVVREMLGRLAAQDQAAPSRR